MLQHVLLPFSRTRSFAVITAVLIVLTVYLVAMLQGRAPDFGGNNWYVNWDTDSYSRIMRVLQWHETGRWYETHAAYFNAPFGMEMHWTRPLDVLLYAGAWVGGQFADFRSALEVWAMVLCGPIFQLLLVWAMFRATRHLPGSGWFLVAVLLIVLQPALASVFRLGFIDFHGLLVVLQMATIAVLLRHVDASETRRSGPRLLGLIAGLAVWISIEGLVLTVLPVAIVLTLLWVWKGDGALDDLIEFGISLGIAVGLALALERPPSDWLTVEYDRISLVHLSMVLASVLALMLVQRVSDQVPVWIRLRNVWLAVIATALALVLLFPGLAVHPQQELGLIVDTVLETQTSESPYFGIYPAAQRVGSILRDIGPLVLILPYMLVVALRGTEAQKRRFAVYAGFLLLMCAYLLLRTRALAFVQLCLVLPWLDMLHQGVQRLAAAGPRAALGRGLAGALAAVLAIGHLIPSAMAGGVGLTGAQPRPSCYPDELVSLLREQRAQASGGTILAPIWNGPALVYRTGFGVISSPYHRNLQGIEDGFALLWLDPDDPDLRQLAMRRHVNFVFVCRNYLEVRSRTIAETPDALIARLAADRPPAWLEKVSLPPGAADRVMLYRTRFGG